MSDNNHTPDQNDEDEWDMGRTQTDEASTPNQEPDDLTEKPDPYGVAWPDEGDHSYPMAETSSPRALPQPDDPGRQDNSPPEQPPSAPDRDGTEESPGDESGIVPVPVEEPVWKIDALLYLIVGVFIGGLIIFHMLYTGESETMYELLAALYVIGGLTHLLGRDAAIGIWESVRGSSNSNSDSNSDENRRPNNHRR